MAKINLRDKILNANDIQSELVTVAEWDVQILVKGLTGQARATLLQESLDMKTGRMDLVKMYPDLLISTCFDPESNTRIFGNEDRDALNAKNGGALEKLALVAMRLSGLEDNAVQNATKN